MQIRCPECKKLLTIGDPKAGSFRPRCKQCGKVFRLKVTDEQPPRLAVGRILANTASPSTNKPKSAAAAKSSAAKSSAAKSSAAKSSAAKSSAAPGSASRGQAAPVAATVDSAANSATAVNATVDSPSDQLSGGAKARRVGAKAKRGAAAKPKAAQTVAGDADATQDEASLDAASQSSGSEQKILRRDSGSRDDADQRTVGNQDATLDGTADGRPGEATAEKSSRRANVKIASGGSAKSQQPAGSKPSLPGEPEPLPDRLGGYRILRLLGRGAMGAVFEAKQMSLDRLVALKTIRSRIARNPSSLARFTREAYAAAQLTHHNVVQIYDFGEDAGKHFFSMEWVRGGPLDKLIKEKGGLDPRLAAGYALQAARGLQFAHRNGMVHRDIKPANLLLSDEGVVKVADLGLVKVPDQQDSDAESRASSSGEASSGTQVTMQGTAVGTPAYMAPEQGVDAASVDHRADIYSLGCTLFYMLAGRAPFGGTSVVEVMQQHAEQPLPKLVELNPRVPEELQQIVERATAKRPDDRYPALPEMIAELESFLGLNSKGDFSPSAKQADAWERIAVQYAESTKKLRLTRPIMAGLVGVSLLLTAALPILVGISMTLFGPAILVSAIVTALILGSLGGPSPVIASLRAWIASLSWMDYGIGVVGALVFMLVAGIAGMIPAILIGGLLGAGLGAADHFLLVVATRRQSEPTLQEAERFVRNLRIEGADEDGVRSFTARYGGDHWQRLFEAVFGYQALVKIRDQLAGDRSFSGSTAGSLRDKICDRLAGKAKANREARDHKRLAKIEERGLQSEGLSAGEARERAWQMAAVVIDHAKLVAPVSADPDVQAALKRDRMKSMLAEARSGKHKQRRGLLAPIRFMLGGQTRLLAGCVLLAIFAVWGENNGMFDSLKDVDVQSLKTIAQEGIDTDTLRHDAETAAGSADRTVIAGASAWSIGLAGLLLAMSAFVSGWRMTPFAIAATVVILFGPQFGIPSFELPMAGQLPAWMIAGLAGVVVYIPGILFGEKSGG